MANAAGKAKNYIAQVGMNIPDGKGDEVRIEAGKPIPDGLTVAKWLIDDGHVKEAD